MNSDESSSNTTGQGGSAATSRPRPAPTNTSSDPPLPSDPTVPIDDHLHWLLVAGVLWGTWRLWRG